MADDMLAQMPYADAVLNEVLRMHSVVDGVWRKALEDLTIQGHHIPQVHPPFRLAFSPCLPAKAWERHTGSPVAP